MHCLLVSSEKYFDPQLPAKLDTVIKTYGLLHIWFYGTSFPAINALMKRIFRKLWFSETLHSFAWTIPANMRIANKTIYTELWLSKKTPNQTRKRIWIQPNCTGTWDRWRNLVYWIVGSDTETSFFTTQSSF